MIKNEITKHDLKPGIKFRTKNSHKVKTIVSICKSRDTYSVDISYKYSDEHTITYDSILIDKEELEDVLEIIE